MTRPFAALATALALSLLPSPAYASLNLCNRTSYVVYAATAALASTGTDVKGWTRIVPGSCAIAIEGDLAAQNYFLYARSARAHSGTARSWGGPVSLCAEDRDFRLRLPPGVVRCSDAASHELGFAPVETHHMRSWTTTLRESPDLPSMPAAARAGLRRLLGDIGVRDLGNDAAVDAALAQFRKRNRMPDKADTASLFSALETEAMKSAVPVGYSICNDTVAAVYAAIGLKTGQVFASKGWWTVAGGTCSQAITDPLSDRVWLRVERPNGAPLVAGPATFCTTNLEFEIQGRERCAQRGLAEAGFAETNVRRLPGYTARVTATGLK